MLHNRLRRILTRSLVLVAALAFLYFLFAPLINWVHERAFAPPISCGAPYDLVPGSYRNEGSRQWEGGTVVLYSAQCALAGQPALPLEGAYLRTEADLTSDVQYGGQTIGAAPVGQLLSYSQSRGDWVKRNGANSGFSLINGRIYAPNVSTIQARFANGQVQRDTPDGALFALIIPTNVPACELQVLDAQENILAQIDLSVTADAEAAECHKEP